MKKLIPLVAAGALMVSASAFAAPAQQAPQGQMMQPSKLAKVEGQKMTKQQAMMAAQHHANYANALNSASKYHAQKAQEMKKAARNAS